MASLYKVECNGNSMEVVLQGEWARQQLQVCPLHTYVGRGMMLDHTIIWINNRSFGMFCPVLT